MRRNKKILSFAILSAMAVASATSVHAATDAGTETKIVAVGDTVKVNTNNISATKYVWTSSNKAIASVNKNGVVTGKKNGTVCITGTRKVNNTTKKIVVTVKVVSLQNKGEQTITAGENSQLNIKKYEGSTYQWTSDNEAVASISDSGVVTANKEGTATVRCYAQSASKKKAYVAKYIIKVNTEKKVATQAQLTKALQNTKITKLIIDTKKDIDFTIPQGDYQNIALSVNAPNADVENQGVFKSIKILMIKPNTWHEQANGNKITVRALQARIVVEDGASVDAMSFTKKDANVQVEVNGNVNKLKVTQSNSVNVKASGTIKEVAVNAPSNMNVETNGSIDSIAINAAANLTLSGKAENGVKVVASDKAEGAKVNSTVKVAIDTPVKMEVSLQKGAEGSTVKVSEDKVEVAVKNETEDKITVETPTGNKEVDTSNQPLSDDNITAPDVSEVPDESTKPDNSQNLAQQSGLQIVSVESVENGKVRLKLNKSYPQLTKEMISIICTTGGSDMTVQSIQASDNYQTFDISTAFYDDNTYSLAIVFSDNSLIEKDFVSKYDCPEITSVIATRISDTEANISYISDEPGNLYYILKEDTSAKALSTKAVHQVPNELDGITENNMIQNGTKISMNNQFNEFKISGLQQGISYSLYYMAESSDGKTTLIKKMNISADIVAGDSSEIHIEKADGFYKYESFFGENYRYEITLSQPTKEALTLDDFRISCPSDGNMSLGRLVTTDNQTYIIYMKVGSIPKGNNTFTATITFADGTTAQKQFYVDFDAPIIKNTDVVERTGEKEIKVTLDSSEKGYIYWTVLKPSDQFDPTSIASKDPKLIMDSNPPEKQIAFGEGSYTLSLDSIPEDGSYFCFITKDEKGNESSSFYYFKIPAYTPPVNTPDSGEGDAEQKTFKILSVTPSKYSIGACLYLDFSVEGNISLNQDGTKICIQYSRTKKNYEIPHSYIDSTSSSFVFKDINYASGEYTITITLPDGRVGTKTFTIS